MIMDGIKEKLQNEHEDYIQLKTRVDVAVDLMATDEYFHKESLLRVLGTEKAVKLADELHKADEERRAMDLDRYAERVTNAQV